MTSLYPVRLPPVGLSGWRTDAVTSGFRQGRGHTLARITVTDPGDPGRLVFVVRNTIGRNLICSGLAPGVSGGFFPGEVNVVGGNATGQCASLV